MLYQRILYKRSLVADSSDTPALLLPTNNLVSTFTKKYFSEVLIQEPWLRNTQSCAVSTILELKSERHGLPLHRKRGGEVILEVIL